MNEEADRSDFRLRDLHEHILNSVAEGIHVIDRNGIVLVENAASARMLGWPEGTLIGQFGHHAMHHHHADGRDFPLSDCPIFATARDGQMRSVGEDVFWRRDGSCFPVEYTAVPLHDRDGAQYGVAVLFRDISERKRVEKMRDALIKADHFASLGRLIAGIAHEANTPLGIIRTSSSMAAAQLNAFEAALAARELSAAKAQAFIDLLREANSLVERSAERAAGLISGFRQLTAEQAASPTRHFDVADALDLALQLMQADLAKHHITVCFDAAPGMEVVGDQGRFEQVFVNILGNVIEHAFGVRTNGQVDIRASRDNTIIVISVSDDGVGMAADVSERVFEPFFTTRFGSGGSGLGLYIAHTIVCSLFHGSVSVDSYPGRGTTLTIRIPAAA